MADYLITRDEAAELLSVSPGMVRKMQLVTRQLSLVKIGNAARVRRSEVDALIDGEDYDVNEYQDRDVVRELAERIVSGRRS
jgi:excisionase family DNA binding protein